MKICLIRPPSFCGNLSYPSGPRFGLPLSLLYLAAVIEKAGHKVEIYDALTDIDCDLSNLLSSEDGFYHIGASYEKIGQKISEITPDTVGITNPFSDFFECTIKTATAIKSVLPSVPVIVGGPHATSAPESFIYENSPIDYVMRGECETSILELINAIETKKEFPLISKIAPFINDLDSLPLPAYHLIDMEKIFSFVKSGFPSRYSFEYPMSYREVSIVTSRGCPYNCIFCGNHIHMGRKWRYHSVEYIIRHIEHLVKNYAVRHFHIEDDNLGMDIVRFESFLDALIAKKFAITWDTPNGIRADRMNAEIIKKAKKSGCTYLIFGIESGNQRVINEIINKNLKLDVVMQNARDAYKQKLDIHAFFVVGFPNETKKEIFDTFRFAIKFLLFFDVIPHLCLARPLPGTKLYDLCESGGYLTEPILPQIGKGLRGEVFDRRMIKTKDFSPELLENWVGKFNRNVILLIVLKSLFFMFLHPFAAFKILKKFINLRGGLRQRLLKLFFGGLFFKFNFLERRSKK